MPPKVIKGEYIETETGNKVSRRSNIHGTQNIILGGRTVIQSEAVVRGDLIRTATHSSSSQASTTSSQPSQQLAISTGKYTLLAPASILHPPRKLHRGQFSHHPQKIGDHVYIGPGAVIEAASLGSNVWIGAGAIVGRLATVKDGAKVLDGAVVPPGMVVGPGDIVGGRPARKVGEMGWGDGWEGREAWKSI
ncbi:MAG: hypothetical protein LQ340_004572 [Diploschistes diacapsis]|nr:MAG: hypothetical protein LQ340_004572 [Diploschistes diacapsis]